MVSRTHAEVDQRSGQIEALFIKLPEGCRLKNTCGILPAKRRHAVIAAGGICKNLGQRGSILVSGHGEPSSRAVADCHFVSLRWIKDSKLYLARTWP